jgi:RNA polymerase-binding protein DksA
MAEATVDLLTPGELEAIRVELQSEAERLRSDLSDSATDIAELLSDSGDGSGDDIADAGSKTFEREQELYVAEQVRESLRQVERALGRIEDGTYGLCETCGLPIGKLRLEAFPRATQCMSCKVAQGG